MSVTLNVENQFHMVNGRILVVIHGVEKNLSTSRATGAYSVVWNEEHTLNLSHRNILSIKTAQSSHTLGLLALATQMEELKMSNVIIISTSESVKSIVQQIPLWKNQQFLREDNSLMTNHGILSGLYDLIDRNKLELEVMTFSSVQGLLLDLCQRLVGKAKKLSRERMCEIRAAL